MSDKQAFPALPDALDGMTLYQYYVGQALSGAMRGIGKDGPLVGWQIDTIANSCLLVADEVIRKLNDRELKKRSEI